MIHSVHVSLTFTAQLDGQITQVVGDIQKVESKLAQLRETFERQKVDIRSLQREQQANSRALDPKVCPGRLYSGGHFLGGGIYIFFQGGRAKFPPRRH